MPKNTNGEYIFKDYPQFRPNKTVSEIFHAGAFGGTYWRPIYSSVTKQNYKNQHKKFPNSWWSGLSSNHLTRDFKDYDHSINKYGVKVGTTLEYWEKQHWITTYDPYGWVQWMANFFIGRRCPDDERQIKRWLGIAGPNGRFRLNLIRQIYKSKKKWNDYSVSPRIRQTLLHWGYELTKKDYENGLKVIKKSKK